MFGVDVGQLNGNQVVDLRRNFNTCMNQTKHEQTAWPQSCVSGFWPFRWWQEVFSWVTRWPPLLWHHGASETLTTPASISNYYWEWSSELFSTFLSEFLDLGTVVAAVLDDPLHLLVNQLHTTQAGFLQALDLPLHEQLEGNLRHK